MKLVIVMTLPETWINKRDTVADTALSALRLRIPIEFEREEIAFRHSGKNAAQALVWRTYAMQTPATLDEALGHARAAETAAMPSLSREGLSRGFRVCVLPPVEDVTESPEA